MDKCIFCHGISNEDVLIQTDNFFVVFDIDPIQEGHLLIISKKHIMNISQLSNDLLLELSILEKKIINDIENNFQVLGITMAINNGRTMDDGVHFHVHIIPRYTNDEFWENIKIHKQKLDKQKLKNILNLL